MSMRTEELYDGEFISSLLVLAFLAEGTSWFESNSPPKVALKVLTELLEQVRRMDHLGKACALQVAVVGPGGGAVDAAWVFVGDARGAGRKLSLEASYATKRAAFSVARAQKLRIVVKRGEPRTWVVDDCEAEPSSAALAKKTLKVAEALFRESLDAPSRAYGWRMAVRHL